MPELAYVNGQWGPVGEARVSIEDRGFQFGDGIYEVVVAYGGEPFVLDRHLERLRRSADGIALGYDFSARPLEPIIREGLRRSEIADAMVYLQITRGTAPRCHVAPPDLSPTVVMTFKPLHELPASLRENGARVMTTLDTRWANCSIKAITLLPNVLAKSEAVRQGYDDAIFVSADGEVRECTSANVFAVKEDHLHLPPRNDAVLHGITQSFIMECAVAVGMRVREERMTLDHLLHADEVFLSSTIQEVLGITVIDGRSIGQGAVGPYTRRLYDEFHKKTRT